MDNKVTPEEVAKFIELGGELAEFLRARRPFIAAILTGAIALVVRNLET